MSDPSRSLYSRFLGRPPDPITAGTSLDTVQSGADGRAPVGRPARQPRQLMVRLTLTQERKTNLDHPELVITWGSEFPDKLKIRKEVTLWPLRFKLRADYTRALRAIEYGCSCKDTAFGGRIRVDAARNEIEYRKRLRLGNGMIGATVRGSYAGIWDASARLQPQVSFEYELWGGAAIWAGNAINWRHKFRAPKLSRSLALEVAGNVELPAPAARYEWQREEAQRLSVGQGAFRLHLDQCNVVVNL